MTFPACRVSVVPVDLRRIPADAWDCGAVRAGATMRSAHAHLTGLRVKYFFRAGARVFQVYLRDGVVRTPIGHYTLVYDGGARAFYDGLNLYPEYRQWWDAALAAALARAGPGHFRYGWQWSPEPSREQELHATEGVQVLSVRPILVQGVDFARWPDWDAYHRDISENVRRNVKKAQKAHPDLAVSVVAGLGALRQVPTLVGMRRSMYRRKRLRFDPVRVLVGNVLSVAACPSQAMVALATGGGRVLAINNYVEFADRHYYLDGAACEDADGAAWHLQVAMLRRAYARAPRGKFLLGYTDVQRKTQAGEGLIRSRRSLRVTDWPTSVVRFNWRRSPADSLPDAPPDTAPR